MTTTTTATNNASNETAPIVTMNQIKYYAGVGMLVLGAGMVVIGLYAVFVV